MLITFEGGEGAGKTTLIKQVVDFFYQQGTECVQTREPGGTALGAQMRRLVLRADPDISICPKAELMLYLTSRAQILEEVIAPALNKGQVVLCDRFNDSTIVYQGVARGLGIDAVAYLCRFICGSIKPDLTFYLDVDPKIGLARTKKTAKEDSAEGETDRIESEGISFHEKVRQAYLEIVRQDPERVVVLDANQSLEGVWKDARKVLEQCSII